MDRLSSLTMKATSLKGGGPYWERALLENPYGSTGIPKKFFVITIEVLENGYAVG
jgi:hypothetical protein